MALRGTLKDFGIADIFQLIGHQQKTGVLTVKNRDQLVRIHFREGNVVRAESTTRKQRDLLGAMLVRAEVITDPQLAKALSTQTNTSKRLGELLIEQTSLDPATLKAFAKLQTTETIYHLFLWEVGTYEFEAAEVPAADPNDLIRSESVLMEGFRQLDEWPAIRKKISGYGLRFKKLEDIDALLAKAGDAAKEEQSEGDPFDDLDLGAAKPKDTRLGSVGDTERFVYTLVQDDRDVQKIIDLSRLGEFETCKALVNLMDARIVEAIASADGKVASARPTVGGILAGRAHWLRIGARALILAVVVGGVVFAGWRASVEVERLISPQVERGYVDLDLQEALSKGQMQRVARALELYRLERGEYPAELSSLVSAELMAAKDMQFPWQQPYYYARTKDGYALLRPLY